jgi:hypothetical protein
MKPTNKAKPSRRRRNAGGRKSFGDSKQISPAKTVQDNLNIAALGEFAQDRQRREIFDLVARWSEHYSAAFKDHPDTGGALLNRNKRREYITARLLRIMVSALDNYDPQPFQCFIKAIALAQNLNTNGALSPDHYEVLRVVELLELELGETVVQKEVSPQEFKSHLRRRIGERQFARIKSQIGLHFQQGRPKRKH